MFHVEEYLSRLLPILVPFSYSTGKGPIIAYQIENEFGSYGEDPKYLSRLKEIYIKYGVKDLMFTSDGQYDKGKYGYLRGGLPGILKTANFALHPESHVKELLKVQPNEPVMVTEFWSGWFDHWFEHHHAYNPEDFGERLTYILKSGYSVNFYMFVGGTNFGFWNGANANSTAFKPTVTSYDYDAPVSEAGDIKPKFYTIRNILQKLNLAPQDLPEIPANPPKMSYGTVKMKFAMPFSRLLDKISIKRTYDDIRPMELIDLNNKGGQGYGWIVYKTDLPKGKYLEIHGDIRDYATILINQKYVTSLMWNTTELRVKVPQDILTDSKNILHIFVENMGRVNFKYQLNKQRKGILGDVYLDGNKLKNWVHYPLEFRADFRRSLFSREGWSKFNPYKGPAAYKGYFKISDQPKDTFILMDNWPKGIVLINNFNIGRYWEVGPQKTLYVPSPVLVKGKNEIIIFDTHRAFTHVQFINEHLLGSVLEK